MYGRPGPFERTLGLHANTAVSSVLVSSWVGSRRSACERRHEVHPCVPGLGSALLPLDTRAQYTTAKSARSQHKSCSCQLRPPTRRSNQLGPVSGLPNPTLQRNRLCFQSAATRTRDRRLRSWGGGRGGFPIVKPHRRPFGAQFLQLGRELLEDTRAGRSLQRRDAVQLARRVLESEPVRPAKAVLEANDRDLLTRAVDLLGSDARKCRRTICEI